MVTRVLRGKRTVPNTKIFFIMAVNTAPCPLVHKCDYKKQIPSIKFRRPIIGEDMDLSLDNDKHVESAVLMVKGEQ